MSLQLSAGEATATGPRAENQDALRIVTPTPALAASKGSLFALADGVSQCADGGLAARASVQVLCAIDTKSAVGARGQPRTPVGEFDEDTATLYLFEDEWALVSDFTSVDLGGSTYVRIKRLIPLGLFDVQVEQVHVRAVDES